MRILFLTSGKRVPSSRFRVHQFIPHLKRLGHRCVVSPCRPDKYDSFPLVGFLSAQLARKAWRQFQISRLKPDKFDAVFLERELLSSPRFGLEERLRSVTKRLILDVDDGLFALHPKKFERLASMADAVIA